MTQLTAIETSKLQNPSQLIVSLLAKIQRGDKVEVKPINCKLEITTYPDDNTAIRFSFLVSNYVKGDSKLLNPNGKPVKMDIELWQPAKEFSFSKAFELSVINHQVSIFNDSVFTVEEYDKVRYRSDVADIFLSMIETNKLELIEYFTHEEKQIVRTAYDPSILLLVEFLKHSTTSIKDNAITGSDVGSVKIEKLTYTPLPNNIICQCFIDAHTKLVDLGYPSLPGTMLYNLNDFGTKTLGMNDDRLHYIANIIHEDSTQDRAVLKTLPLENLKQLLTDIVNRKNKQKEDKADKPA